MAVRAYCGIERPATDRNPSPWSCVQRHGSHLATKASPRQAAAAPSQQVSGGRGPMKFHLGLGAPPGASQHWTSASPSSAQPKQSAFRRLGMKPGPGPTSRRFGDQSDGRRPACTSSLRLHQGGGPAAVGHPARDVGGGQQGVESPGSVGGSGRERHGGIRRLHLSSASRSRLARSVGVTAACPRLLAIGAVVRAWHWRFHQLGCLPSARRRLAPAAGRHFAAAGARQVLRDPGARSRHRIVGGIGQGHCAGTP